MGKGEGMERGEMQSGGGNSRNEWYSQHAVEDVVASALFFPSSLQKQGESY